MIKYVKKKNEVKVKGGKCVEKGEAMNMTSSKELRKGDIREAIKDNRFVYF